MTPRVAAAAVVSLEGAGAVVTGAGFVIAALVGRPDAEGVAVTLGVLLALYGAGIGCVARGILRGRPWARTPAYLVQFFALVVAWYQRHTLLAVTVAVGVVAIVAIGCLAAATRENPQT